MQNPTLRDKLQLREPKNYSPSGSFFTLRLVSPDEFHFFRSYDISEPS